MTKSKPSLRSRRATRVRSADQQLQGSRLLDILTQGACSEAKLRALPQPIQARYVEMCVESLRGHGVDGFPERARGIRELLEDYGHGNKDDLTPAD